MNMGVIGQVLIENDSKVSYSIIQGKVPWANNNLSCASIEHQKIVTQILFIPKLTFRSGAAELVLVN